MIRRNPFPGLRPFEPDEDDLFFGRERETDELLRRLRTRRFVSVLGTSGSGKSSLVRSGLVPSLYSGYMVGAGSTWRVAVMRPGGDPIGNLAAALNADGVLGTSGELADTQRMLLETTLRRSALGLADCLRLARLAAHENLLVVVDQFEELFRFKRSRKAEGAEDDAVAFARLLLESSGQEEVPLYVVTTMRSDFIGDCMEYPGLPEAINEGQYLIPRMTRKELRSAIQGPVAVGGGAIGGALVTRLLNEVGDAPDRLPVLQHALMRTWDHWAAGDPDAGPLGVSHYEAIGTMAEALSRHAEEAYQELAGERQRTIAEQMFKTLTELGYDNRGVRRPTSIREIAVIAEAEPPEVVEVVEHFRRPGRSFLMPPAGVELGPQAVLDISHESLMRCWTRLSRWSEEEQQSGKNYRRLCRAARRYAAGQAGLWVDPELQLGVNWREENRPSAAWAERYDPDFDRATAFLAESEAGRERQIEAERRARAAKLRRARWLAAVLGGAALVTFFFGVAALRAKREANREAATSQQVSKFLVELFEVADPENSLGEKVTAREILDEGARKVENELADQPEVQARLMDTIGDVYGNLGLHEQARSLLERGLEIRERTLDEDDAEVGQSLFRLGKLAGREANFTEGREALDRALAVQEKALGPRHPDVARTLAELGDLEQDAGDYRRATKLLERAIRIREEALGTEHPDYADSLADLAGLRYLTKDFAEARELCEQALAIREKALGPEHPDVADALQCIAVVGSELGVGPDERLSLNERALAIQEKVYGPDHPALATTLNNIGATLSEMDDHPGSAAAHQRALSIREKALGPDHPAVAYSLHNLAMGLLDRGEPREALELLERSLAIREKAYGHDHVEVARALHGLAAHAERIGDYEHQVELYREALKIRERVFGPDHPDLANSLTPLANTLMNLGRFRESRELLERQLALLKAALGPEHQWVGHQEANLGYFLMNAGEYEAAKPLLESGLAIKEKHFGAGHENLLFTLGTLTSLFKRTREYDKALLYCERGLAIVEAQDDTSPWELADQIESCAKIRRKTGDEATADAMDERARSIREAG